MSRDAGERRRLQAVADELGCSTTTVQRLEDRALAKMREALEKRPRPEPTPELRCWQRVAFTLYLELLMRYPWGEEPEHDPPAWVD